ncbi:MerR family transcriptional regulator [Sandarakinorhabdus sp. DWP1-3-1]|uniref:MerR family transcriptional regulator n=1 Tax=Sandarakinorhabdus sp. DWP1-3-1 TaxID=2804627 RepID=UPI003CF43E5C
MASAGAGGSADKEKSDRAFRTISEAAETIGVPQHVLRFWETRFPQLQPLKRGGNRRYYRPADMALLATIKAMLHDEGLTIRGAQLALGGTKDRAKPAPVRTVMEPPPAPEAVPAIVPTPVATFVPPSIPGPILDLAALRDIRDRLRHALAA